MEYKTLRQSRYFFFVIALILLPIVAYGAMHLLTHLMPMSEDSTGTHLLLTLIIFFFGLAVPFWMLKLGTKAAHENNPAEPEAQLKDIPKDKEQLDRKLRTQHPGLR